MNTHKLFAGLYGTREAELRGSIDYYERAAQLGHLDAITDLGYIYEKGVKGKDGNCYIEPHLDFAFKYYMLAKKEGFPRAYNNIGSLCIAATETAQQGEQASI